MQTDKSTNCPAPATFDSASHMQSDRELAAQDIVQYLKVHERKEILQFLTCGSVDDGKSTLIGRLLHDTDVVYTDHLEALERDSKRAGRTGGELDLSLLVDGLQAEREQGITIDVAYRYFSTSSRKFIIADCPGHEQYTRNMATGASNCELAVILIDARHGVLPQTKQHTYVANLLGIRNVVIAINKMDLMSYDQQRFNAIRADFQNYLDALAIPNVQFIPISAKQGDNVVRRSTEMPWYQGPTLLSYLHTIPVAKQRLAGSFRMVVQRVNRPDENFRGYSGTIASGVIRTGQTITLYPSGLQTTVDRIVTMDGDLAEAHAPMAVTLTLTDNVDSSRGDVFVAKGHPLKENRSIHAKLVWMDDSPLRLERKYIMKHGASKVLASVSDIGHRIGIEDLTQQPVKQLVKNDIGYCRLALDKSIYFDTYYNNRVLGGFILIDRLSNRTVGAGMIEPDQEGEMCRTSSSRPTSIPLAVNGTRADSETNQARHAKPLAAII